MANFKIILKNAGASLLAGLFLINFTSCSTSQQAYKADCNKLDVVASVPSKNAVKGNVERVTLPQATVAKSQTPGPEAMVVPVKPVQKPVADQKLAKVVESASFGEKVVTENQKTHRILKTAVKADKKELKKLLNDKKANALGLTLLLVGLILLIAALIAGLLGIGILSTIFGSIGGLLVLIGIVVWILEILD